MYSVNPCELPPSFLLGFAPLDSGRTFVLERTIGIPYAKELRFHAEDPWCVILQPAQRHRAMALPKRVESGGVDLVMLIRESMLLVGSWWQLWALPSLFCACRCVTRIGASYFSWILVRRTAPDPHHPSMQRTDATHFNYWSW